MTAFLSVRNNRCIHVLADGAYYDTDGILRRLDSKMTPLPLWQTCVVARGLGGMAAGFAYRVTESSARSFDDVVTLFPELHRRTIASALEYVTAEEVQEHELFLAGWSHAEAAPATYYFSNTGGRELQRTSAVFACGPMIDISGIDPETFVPADGIPLFETMRATPAPGPKGTPIRGVGGFVEWCCVTSTIMGGNVLHTWPEDVVGSPIGGRQ